MANRINKNTCLYIVQICDLSTRYLHIRVHLPKYKTHMRVLFFKVWTKLYSFEIFEW